MPFYDADLGWTMLHRVVEPTPPPWLLRHMMLVSVSGPGPGVTPAEVQGPAPVRRRPRRKPRAKKPKFHDAREQWDEGEAVEPETAGPEGEEWAGQEDEDPSLHDPCPPRPPASEQGRRKARH